MGSTAAYVVHGFYESGAGLDELTTTGPSRISHLRRRRGRTASTSTPPIWALHAPRWRTCKAATPRPTRPSPAASSAANCTGPKRDVVLLNAAAALSIESGDLEDGLTAARISLNSGAALDALDRYIAATRSFAAA